MGGRIKKNIYVLNCPADQIREYIEKLINIQRKYIEKGQGIPEEYSIPSRIEISPENVKFLINSNYVDFWGAGKTGNEINFYWKKQGNIPALEVRIERLEDGKFYLSYIREEASKTKPSFEWNNKEKNQKGEIVVSKESDALEDIFDMDNIIKK